MFCSHYKNNNIHLKSLSWYIIDKSINPLECVFCIRFSTLKKYFIVVYSTEMFLYCYELVFYVHIYKMLKYSHMYVNIFIVSL